MSISSSAIEFWMIPGVPPGGGGGWMVVGVVRGCTPPTCTCTCMHTCACTCTHVWHHREFPGISPMGLAICMKLPCLPCMHVRACAYVHAHACAHVWGAPQTTPTPIHPPPTPKSCRKLKTPKFNNSWTNRDNSILFEDSLPLNTPELI